jgi:hypothetical protein
MSWNFNSSYMCHFLGKLNCKKFYLQLQFILHWTKLKQINHWISILKQYNKKYNFNKISSWLFSLYCKYKYFDQIFHKSASHGVHWRHYLKSRFNFRIFSNRRPFQTLISIGPFTWSNLPSKIIVRTVLFF